MEKFRSGVSLHGRRTAPADIRIVKPGANPWYEVKLTEGRQNQIRLMFQDAGLLVEKLKRVRIGFLKLAGLPPGAFRHLDAEEVARFRRLLKLDQPKPGK
jgi:23S rRNA pseudouridine2605 synthase